MRMLVVLGGVLAAMTAVLLLADRSPPVAPDALPVDESPAAVMAPIQAADPGGAEAAADGGRVVVEGSSPAANRVSIRGRVCWADGAPAVGATVSHERAATGWIHKTGASSSVDGEFVLQLERGAAVRVRAELDRHQSQEVAVTAVAGDPREISLVLPHTPLVAGRLIGPAGESVRGEIRIWRAEPDRRGGSSGRSVQTSSDGGFRFDIRRGQTHVVIGTGPHFGSSPVERVRLTEEHSSAQLVLQLRHLTAVAGVVVDETGQRLVSGRVSLVPEWNLQAGLRRAPAWASTLRGASQDADVGDDGSFAFEGVHSGSTWTLEYSPQAGSLISVQKPGVRSGDRGVRLVVARRELRGCVISGVVRDVDGAVLTSYGIKIVGPWQVVTDDAGRFELPRAPRGEEYPVYVRRAPSERPQLLTRVRADKAEVWLALQLQALGSLEVIAQTGEGEPARGVRVQARSLVGDATLPLEAPVDARGQASLRDVVPGTYRVRIYRGRVKVAEAETTVRPGQTEVVRVDLGRR